MRNTDTNNRAGELHYISIEIADEEYKDHIQQRPVSNVHHCEKGSGKENPKPRIKIPDCIVLNNTTENQFLREAGTNHHDYDGRNERPEGKLQNQWIGHQNEIFDKSERYARARNCK